MKNHHLIITVILLISIMSCSKKNLTKAPVFLDHKSEIVHFQKELNKDYFNINSSPMSAYQIKALKGNGGHDFFPIDEKYRVNASLDKTNVEKNIEIKTSTSRLAVYDIYGVANFEINGKQFSVNIYQSQQLSKNPEYKDYLFFPFTDLTNGEESYGGGRYIDLRITEGNTIKIDFNKAYNPYCAYSDKYSCPIPPPENFMDIEIKAGVMKSPLVSE